MTVQCLCVDVTSSSILIKQIKKIDDMRLFVAALIAACTFAGDASKTVMVKTDDPTPKDVMEVKARYVYELVTSGG